MIVNRSGGWAHAKMSTARQKDVINFHLNGAAQIARIVFEFSGDTRRNATLPSTVMREIAAGRHRGRGRHVSCAAAHA